MRKLEALGIIHRKEHASHPILFLKGTMNPGEPPHPPFDAETTGRWSPELIQRTGH